jgi:hypothetical protein
MSRVFLLSTATPHKFYTVMRVQQGWNSKDGYAQNYMNAVYIPTAYGIVTGGGLGKFEVGGEQKRFGQ